MKDLFAMDKQSIIQYKGAFDAIATYIESDNGQEQVEVWFARDLQKVLGYARWENFLTAINRAVESCNNQNINVDDHFRDLTKMIENYGNHEIVIDLSSELKY